MTLGLDASSPAGNAIVENDVNVITSAAFTAPANSRILAFFGQDSTNGLVGVTTSIADSGGLTWTLVGRVSSQPGPPANTPTPTGATQPGMVSIWTAVPTTAVSRTVTVTESGSDATLKSGALAVRVFTDTGTPGIGAVGAAGGNGILPSKAITTTANNSWVWAINTDWNSGGNGTFPAGQTADYEWHRAAIVTVHTWKQTSLTPTSGTVVTMNQTAPTQQFNMLVVEITPAAASVDPGPGDVLLTGVAGGIILTGVGGGVERLTSLLD